MKRKMVYRMVPCLLLIGMAGCASEHDWGPTGTVEGQLTHRGETLAADTKVVFMHSHNGVAAFGGTDDSGKFKVRTTKGDKIPIGTYRVMIQPPESELGDDTREPTAEELLNDPDINRPKPNTGGFDFKYRQVSTSGLEYDVVEGENRFEIDLQ